MLTATPIFIVTLVLVIWQPRGLGIGWSASFGALVKGRLGDGVDLVAGQKAAQACGLMLVAQIRDEAHRFAITYHRQQRSKRMRASALDAVPGLGPARRTDRSARS